MTGDAGSGPGLAGGGITGRQGRVVEAERGQCDQKQNFVHFFTCGIELIKTVCSFTSIQVN